MKRTGLVLVILMSCIGLAGAEDLKALIGKVSPTGVDSFSKLAVALGEATGNTVKVEVVPTSRGVYLVENGQGDFYGPMTASKDPAIIASLGFDYSTAVTHETQMVLYMNKKSTFTVDDLKKGNKANLKIETTASMADFYGFKSLPTTNIEASLKKIDSGLIDGLVYSQTGADDILKKLGLKSIKRVSYDTAQGVFAIKKGSRGGAIDKMLSKGIASLKASGKYATIMGELVSNGATYNDWQP